MNGTIKSSTMDGKRRKYNFEKPKVKKNESRKKYKQKKKKGYK